MVDVIGFVIDMKSFYSEFIVSLLKPILAQIIKGRMIMNEDKLTMREDSLFIEGIRSLYTP